MNEQKDIEKMATEAVKQEAKKGAEKVGKELGKKVRKILLKLLLQIGGALFGSFGGLIFLVIIIVLIILGVFNGTSQRLHNATEDGENAGNVGYVSRLVRINNDTRTYEIDSEEFIKYAEEFLNLNNITAKGLGISDDYSELKKFMEAEIVTSFPDLRKYDERGNPVPEGEIQGCIQFEREDNIDGTLEPMEYVPYAEFSKSMAEMGVKIDDEETTAQIYTTYSDLKAAYEKIKMKFTIDNEGNVYFAGASSRVTHVEYSQYAMDEEYYHKSGRESEEIFKVTYRKVNYQDNVQKYAMPFELLFALQLNTKNCGYTCAVADMAKDSLIVYEIQENIVNTEEIIKYNWVSNFRCSLKHYIKKQNSDGTYTETTNNYGPVDGPEYNTKTVNADINGTDFYEKITIGNSETTLKPVITYVDCWIAYYNAKYTKKTEEPVIEPVKEEPQPSEDYKLYPSMTWHNLETEFANSGLKYNPVSVDATKGEDQKGTWAPEEKRSNITITYYKTTTETKYEPPEEVEVEEQVEKFLSLLAVDPELIDEETGLPVFNVEDVQKNEKGIKEYEGIEGFKSKPINPIINDRQVLLFMLMNNEKTKDVSETVSYLIKILTGEVKVDPTRREKYKPNPIPPGPGDGDGYAGGNITEKLWWALKDAGYSDVSAAAVLGNVIGESAKRTNNLENRTDKNQKNFPEKYLQLELTYGSGSQETDKQYTADVDSGAWVLQHGKLDYNLGYGLVQWTFGRHETLFNYCLNVKHCSVADEDAQIDMIMAEITGNGSVPGAGKQFLITTYKNIISGNVESWNESRWKDTNDIEEATMAFCHSWERPSNACGQGRINWAKYYLDLYGDGKLKKPDSPPDPEPKPNIDPDAPVSERLQALLDLAVQLKENPSVKYPAKAAPKGTWPCYIDEYGNPATGYNYPYFDCGGLIYYLYHTCFPEITGMTASPGLYPTNLGYAYVGEINAVGIDKLRPGDILHLKYPSGGYHIMLYFGEVDGVKKYIHSSSFGNRLSFRNVAYLLSADGVVSVYRVVT